MAFQTLVRPPGLNSPHFKLSENLLLDLLLGRWCNEVENYCSYETWRPSHNVIHIEYKIMWQNFCKVLVKRYVPSYYQTFSFASLIVILGIPPLYTTDYPCVTCTALANYHLVGFLKLPGLKKEPPC